MKQLFTLVICLFLTSALMAQNVGIGTQTPEAKLEVKGAIKVDSFQNTHTPGTFLEWNKDSVSGMGYLLNHRDTFPGGFIFGEIDSANIISERLRIDGQGNLGIGTIPFATLDVNRGTGPAGTAAFRGTDNISHFNFFEDENTYLRGGKSTSFLILNDVGGNVGIGTTTPTSKLSVIGDADISSTLLIGDANIPTTSKLNIFGFPGQEGLDLSTSDQYANLRVLRNSFGTIDKDMYFGFQSGPVSSLHFYSNNSESMTLKDGKLGIGTNLPSSTLDVVGQVTSTTLKITGGAANGLYLKSDASGLASWASLPAETDPQVNLATVNRVPKWNGTALVDGAIVDNGSIGIGVSTPNASALLDVSSTTKGVLIPRMTSAQRIAIGSPVQGLEVFDTTTGTFWYYTGSEWQNVSGVVSGPKDIIEFAVTGTTTWVCPAGVYSVVVEMWGSGGGGGGGGSVGSGTGTCPPPGGTGTGGSSGGGTGGGGGYIRDVISVTPGVSYTIRIGAGGAGGAINANGVTGGITDIKQASTTLVAISGGTGGAKGNATSGTCTTAGGVGGTGGVVTGAGLKRNGRTGYNGADSTLATGPGGACICGVLNSTLSSPKLDGPPSYKGSFEGPLNVGVGGDGGKGAANADFNTSGDAGGQGYLILTLY